MANHPSPQTVPGAFMEAWNRHDMQALAALFAEDANFVNVVGMWWKSRAEIHAAHEATHATIFRNSRLEGEIGAITDLGSGVVALHLTWQLSGMSDPQGNQAPPRRGILLFILQEFPDSGWRIKVAQNTDIIEGAMVPQQPD